MRRREDACCRLLPIITVTAITSSKCKLLAHSSYIIWCLVFCICLVLLAAGKDSVPTTVHHVVVEVDPSKYGQLLKSERVGLYSTDGVHLPNSRDQKESQSDLVKT